jgi:ABC-type Na+ transport system ATPase subunit NatA
MTTKLPYSIVAASPQIILAERHNKVVVFALHSLQHKRSIPQRVIFTPSAAFSFQDKKEVLHHPEEEKKLKITREES